MTEGRSAVGVERDHVLILQAWLCIIGDQRIAYLSGPITTGPRWIAAAQRGESDRGPVIAANSAAIVTAAKALRQASPGLVVEPASLSVREWSQNDYLKLWTTLIERHAASVKFMPGWEYSIGCALEFERAVLHGITTETVAGDPISIEAGLSALEAARQDIAARARAVPQLLDLSERLGEVCDRLARLRSIHATES